MGKYTTMGGYIAGGDKLESFRQGFMENFRNDVPTNPDIPFMSDWPVKHQERMKGLGINLYKHLGISKGIVKQLKLHGSLISNYLVLQL